MFSFNNSVFFIYSIAVITIFGKCHSEIQIVKLATTLIVNLLNRRQSREIKSSSDVFRKERPLRGPWLSWVCNSSWNTFPATPLISAKPDFFFTFFQSLPFLFCPLSVLVQICSRFLSKQKYNFWLKMGWLGQQIVQWINLALVFLKWPKLWNCCWYRGAPAA